MTKVAFHNLGCKVNAYETEAMLQQMQAEGCEIVPFEEDADIYVINTCTVTNIADRKSRQMIHRARKKNPDALVVAVGCYVQADPKAVQEDGAADLIIGNDQKSRLYELIRERTSAVEELSKPRAYEEMSLEGSAEHTRVFLKIQDGCNQFCSYCLIPYVRGRVRSRRREEILAEAGRLAEQGFREIVLTGIHLSSWAMDFPEEAAKKTEEEPYGTALRELILALDEIPGIERIRLGSLEPRIITRSFAEALKNCDSFCPHFHLSLQSGSEATLRRMNRRYTPEEYAEKCEILRSVFEHPAITTDVICGFPGETEEEFAETKAFLEQIRFYETHIFKYSRRSGTAADRMPDQIDERIKTERSHVLQALAEQNKRAFTGWYVGKTEDFLAEEPVEGPGGERLLTGFTRSYVKLQVPAGDHLPGDSFPVTVTAEMLV